jgi:hypothetical protein
MTAPSRPQLEFSREPHGLEVVPIDAGGVTVSAIGLWSLAFHGVLPGQMQSAFLSLAVASQGAAASPARPNASPQIAERLRPLGVVTSEQLFDPSLTEGFDDTSFGALRATLLDASPS